MTSEATFNRIARSINPVAKRQVKRAMLPFLRTLPFACTPDRVIEAARVALQPIFPADSRHHRAMLSFYLIGKFLGYRDQSLTGYSTGDGALPVSIRWKSTRDRMHEEVDPDVRDSLSDMNASDQLRMQAYMDRMTKADQAASEAMKKLSDVCSNIIQNHK